MGRKLLNIKFENSFELLSQEEWNTYLAEENIDSIYAAIKNKNFSQ